MAGDLVRIYETERRVELTRRNLLSLLAKLNGDPPDSACTLKIDGWEVKAVEDVSHYQNRRPGVVHEDTQEKLESLDRLMRLISVEDLRGA